MQRLHDEDPLPVRLRQLAGSDGAVLLAACARSFMNATIACKGPFPPGAQPPGLRRPPQYPPVVCRSGRRVRCYAYHEVPPNTADDFTIQTCKAQGDLQYAKPSLADKLPRSTTVAAHMVANLGSARVLGFVRRRRRRSA